MFLYKLIPATVFSRQARKPSGLLGRWIMSRVFASGNRDLNDLVLSELALTEKDKVLELGFGPGHLLKGIASKTCEAVTEGIDFSEVMVKRASQYNRELIDKGQLASFHPKTKQA